MDAILKGLITPVKETHGPVSHGWSLGNQSSAEDFTQATAHPLRQTAKTPAASRENRNIFEEPHLKNRYRVPIPTPETSEFANKTVVFPHSVRVDIQRNLSMITGLPKEKVPLPSASALGNGTVAQR